MAMKKAIWYTDNEGKQACIKPTYTVAELLAEGYELNADGTVLTKSLEDGFSIFWAKDCIVE